MAILWLGASLVIDNQMTIGMFVAFGSFRGQFSDRVASLTSFLLQLRIMSLHNERIADIALHEKEEKKPEIEIVADMSPVSLETTDLSYRYDSQSAQVFQWSEFVCGSGRKCGYNWCLRCRKNHINESIMWTV
ncbi:ABC transporter ATP-binding protein [Escherichia coli]|uniref:ABC transporter ATP-binding protein n=1 Tax=Escherichia coli TaxID=562 RepID=A0A377K8U7_ECOLX|nr:ABC transporter ATP-binding protein [Escherichia coli]